MSRVLRSITKWKFVALKEIMAIFLLGSVAMGAQESEFVLSPNIKIINIFTAAPQPIDGPSKYAGFGDIAANVVAATELKARYPDRKVRLVVTTAYERIDPLVPTTDDIIKIMVPSLDPSKKGVVQMMGDVEVYFAPIDFNSALKSNGKLSYYWEMFKLSFKTFRHLPKSDLNLNFSSYPMSSPILRVNTELALGLEEHYGDHKMIVDLTGKGFGNRGAYGDMTSGPYSTGFMLTFNRPNREQSLELIRNWGKKAGREIPTHDFHPLIAYSAGWQSIQVYINALSKIRLPEKEMVLFVKDFPEVTYENLPKQIKVIPVKGLPHEVMSALIQESHYSPLVTGDISYGQALSSVREGKALIYESPEWKVDSAHGTQNILAKDLGMKFRDLDPMFLLSEELEKMNDKEIDKKAVEVANLIQDFQLQSRIANAIKARHSSWDIVGNSLKVATHLADTIGIRNLKSVRREETKRNLMNRIEGEFNKNADACHRFYFGF